MIKGGNFWCEAIIIFSQHVGVRSVNKHLKDKPTSSDASFSRY